MPGFVGIISAAPQNDIEQALSRMIGKDEQFVDGESWQC
jgi:hypothetical protein